MPIFKPPQTGWQKPSPKPLKRSPQPSKAFTSTSYAGEDFSSVSPPQGSLYLESPAFKSLTRERYYDIHTAKKLAPPGGTYHPRFDLLEKYTLSLYDNCVVDV